MFAVGEVNTLHGPVTSLGISTPVSTASWMLSRYLLVGQHETDAASWVIIMPVCDSISARRISFYR